MCQRAKHSLGPFTSSFEIDKTEPLGTLQAFGIIGKCSGAASYDMHRFSSHSDAKLAKAQGRLRILERDNLILGYKCFPVAPA